jgi:hypothetical protein
MPERPSSNPDGDQGTHSESVKVAPGEFQESLQKIRGREEMIKIVAGYYDVTNGTVVLL